MLTLEKRAQKTFTPIGDIVLLQVIKVSQSEAGLTLPDGSEESYRTPMAYVIAVGPNCKQCKPGDKVVVAGSQAATRINIAGQPGCVAVREPNIIGVCDV